MSENQKISETIATPIIGSVLAGVVSYWIFGFTSGQAINFLGMVDISAAVGAGLGTAAGIALGEVSKNYILPYLPQDSKLADSEGMILLPVLAGLGTTIVLYKNLDGSMMSYAKAFGLGALTVPTADYLQRTFLQNYIK